MLCGGELRRQAHEERTTAPLLRKVQNESIRSRLLERVCPTRPIDGHGTARNERFGELPAVLGPRPEGVLFPAGHRGDQRLAVVADRPLVSLGIRLLQLAEPIAVEVAWISCALGGECFLEILVGSLHRIVGHRVSRPW